MPDQTTKNMIGVLQAVGVYARDRGWDRNRSMRVAQMCIACVMTEGNGHMYANSGVPTSLQLPHDATGQDHDSVGMFQQRVGLDGSNAHGWGTVKQAMDIQHSTTAFLDRLDGKGLTVFKVQAGTTAYNGHVIRDIFDRIQDVQVSWYDGSGGRPFGGNYRANSARSWRFVLRWWSWRARTARSKVNYL